MTDKETSDFLNLQARVVICEEKLEKIEKMMESGLKSIWEAYQPKKWIRTNETTIGDWTEP